MRYPEFLKENGRIGLIAPSFGCAQGQYRQRLERAISAFEEKGFETVCGPNAFAEEGIGISNTPEKCAAEANDFFLNDRSDVIISCGGGELMCEILPYMDFEAIAKAKPKWFAGYSDNTNFTFLLNTLCDTAAIYGPNAGSFMRREDFEAYYSEAFALSGKNHGQIGEIAEVMFEMSQKSLNLLCGGSAEETNCGGSAEETNCGRKLTVTNYGRWFEEFKTGVDEDAHADFAAHDYKHFLYEGSQPKEELDFSGRLTGGCLDVLANLVGTSFDKVAEYTKKYEEDGIIWFLECCDLNVMSQTRAYWSLENAGWFNNVKAFIIGRPYLFSDSFGDFDHYAAALHSLSKYNVPIILDADLGHLSPMMPIISGAYAHVQADGKGMRIEHVLK